MKKPLVLCILDGCGIREETDGNAFKNANKPTFDYLWNKYPHSLLEASGVNSFDLVSSGLTDGYATKETLWDIDSKPFDIYTFGYQFFNGNYLFNDNNSLPFKISVETLQGVNYDN